MSTEHIGWLALGTVHKFSAEHMREAGFYLGPARLRRVRRWERLREPFVDEMLAAGLPYEIADAGHNLLCNAGINRMESLLIGAGGQAYDATHTAIGVGDGGGSVPTPLAGDTDLAAVVNASNRWFQVADGTYPSQASQVVTVKATVATGNGNFAWNEWGIAGNTSSAAAAATAPLLNHKGAALGTKTSASAWAFTVTITIS